MMKKHEPTSGKRRRLLQLATASLWSAGWPWTRASAAAGAGAAARVRPTDPGWPTEAGWQRLGQAVGGRLIKVQSPLVACRAAPAGAECEQLFKAIKNPYFVGDNVALTQTLGWVDAWT